MHNQTLIRDPNLRRLVSDFDALADVLHTLLARERQPSRRAEALAPDEREFTTEWQMASSTEEVRE